MFPVPLSSVVLGSFVPGLARPAPGHPAPRSFVTAAPRGVEADRGTTSRVRRHADPYIWCRACNYSRVVTQVQAFPANSLSVAADSPRAVGGALFGPRTDPTRTRPRPCSVASDPMDPPTARPGSPGAPLWDPEAIPAATVVVLRDSMPGVEVLMLHRDRDLSFAGGHVGLPRRTDRPGRPRWPGRRAAGHTPDGLRLRTLALESAARAAAGPRGRTRRPACASTPRTLRRWSHWTPPPESPKRFSTAFFVAALPRDAGEVVIDDSEIRDHRWLTPATVLELRSDGEIGLSPPTFITLTQLCRHTAPSATWSLTPRSKSGPEHFATRILLARRPDHCALPRGRRVRGQPGSGPRDGPVTGSPWATTWVYERAL